MSKLFISHASEDKEIARSLASMLIEMGIKVWFDEFELKLGDSLRQTIDKGLKEADFGLVILSHSFFSKNWTQYELDSLITLEIAYSKKILIPVWHKVTQQDVVQYSPRLADKYASSTDRGLTKVVSEVCSAIDIKQSTFFPIYDLNNDEHIELNWRRYNNKSNFGSIRLEYVDSLPVWHLSCFDKESMGLNLFNLPVYGHLKFEYYLQEINMDHVNIAFYMIPIKNGTRLTESGYKHPFDPNNSFSFLRHRTRAKRIVNQWLTENIVYDFSDLGDVAYSIFAPRINEGCPFPANAQLLIRNVQVLPANTMIVK